MLNAFSSLPAASLCVTLPLTAALPLLPSNHVVIAKMSIYKRMRRACCFGCGRSERDCSCMSGRVRGHVDTLGRAFPLSSVSVSDCCTRFRACKFNLDAHSPVSVLSVVLPVSCVVPRGSVSLSGWCLLLTVLSHMVKCSPAACVCVCAKEDLHSNLVVTLCFSQSRADLWHISGN